ncbi:MAG: hypothetical protein EBZ77_17025, partial [Chitinophagia bacterium]|nr:hypothetical protein [Chitinophagia bacterium]
SITVFIQYLKLINASWVRYAMDTTLTCRQIVTTCDSPFLLAGYPEVDSVGQPDTALYAEGSAYSNYCGWKNFWAGRLNAETGKPHDFAEGALACALQN